MTGRSHRTPRKFRKSKSILKQGGQITDKLDFDLPVEQLRDMSYRNTPTVMTDETHAEMIKAMIKKSRSSGIVVMDSLDSIARQR